MNENSNNQMAISEHDVTRVMAGNVENVRQQLVLALEQLGYRVLSENPLQARHGARGGGKYMMSANALDYPTRLEIHLKPQRQGATQILFDYRVQHGAFGKGDRQTLTREAEAIIAVASQQREQRQCSGCGVGVGIDSRYCRKCGTPIVTKVPAELEVLRLTAGARGGYQWMWIGVIGFLISFVFPLLYLWKGTSSGVLAVLGGIVSALSAWAIGAGLRRMHKTINPKIETEELRLPAYSVSPIAVPVTDELPIQYSSITEGTTNLLPDLEEAEPNRREKITS